MISSSLEEKNREMKIIDCFLFVLWFFVGFFFNFASHCMIKFLFTILLILFPGPGTFPEKYQILQNIIIK